MRAIRLRNHFSGLKGTLSVGSITAEYKLEKEPPRHKSIPKTQEINLESNGLRLDGTIGTLKIMVIKVWCL